MPAAAPFLPPASRNAPCPCGSGRRYKECHGALDPASANFDATMRAALAAQQDGRLVDAVAGYERALALVPEHFDALHMLGVVHFQRGEFETALGLIDRALAVRPGVPQAVFNRKLVQHGLAMRSAEAEMGRIVLPRLVRFVDTTAHALQPSAAQHLVLATAEADREALDLAERALGWVGGGAVQRWRETGKPIHRDAVRWSSAATPAAGTAIDVASGAHPHDGHVVIVGVERPPSAWWPHCTPQRVTLVVASDRADFLAVRIRELAGDGRRQVALAYGDASLARRCRLPGRVLGATP